MTTPASARVAAGCSPAACPSIALLRKTLSSGKEAEDGFREWRRHPYTVAFVNALAELVDTPPAMTGGTVTEQILVQYGVTSGLALALKLLTQPNRVYPEVFRGDMNVPDAEDFGAYTDSQDSTIDQL